MSDQAPQPQGQKAMNGAVAGGDESQGADTSKLHDHAIAASKSLEAIATELAHANAPKQTTASFTKMAEACRALSVAVARAPAPEPAAPANRTGESLDAAAEGYAQSAGR